MKTSPLGTTDLRISRIGFGTWAMSGPNSPSYWGPQDDEDSVDTIRAGVERGIDWIDTAAVYGMGHAERIVAEALSPYSDEDRPYVFTKAGMRWDEPGPAATVSKKGSPESLRHELDESLRRLRVERIDLYQMHWPAEDVEVETYWPVFEEFLRSGKVRAIGVSNHTVAQMERALSVGSLHSIQMPLNLLKPDSADDVLPWALEHGVGTLIYSPMASGLLTGKYGSAGLGSLDAADWRRRSPLFAPENLAKVDELVGTLRRIADARGTTVSAISVAWALSRPGVSGAIVGARTPAQIDDWIDAGDIELSAAELEAIEGARLRYARG